MEPEHAIPLANDSNKATAPTMPSKDQKIQSGLSESRGQKRKRGNDKNFERGGRRDKGKDMGRMEYLYVQIYPKTHSTGSN